MSKVVKSIGAIFGGGPKAPDIDRYATTIGGQRTPEQLAEQRAALAAQGRRPKEEELLRPGGTGTRPLQGGGTSFWT